MNFGRTIGINLYAKALTNRTGGVYNCPPSYRFPPLREGNRARVRFPPTSRGEPRKGSVPPARRGNLKEGVFNPLVFANLSSRLV
jgi:hypothetical protein